jgi:hypothetical protein
MYSKREIKSHEKNVPSSFEWQLFRKLERFPFDLEAGSFFLRTLT